MRHFIFHLPVLISERAEDPEAGGAMTVKDVARQAFDVHVHADDLEAAKRAFQDGLRLSVGEAAGKAAVDEAMRRPYVGPV